MMTSGAPEVHQLGNFAVLTDARVVQRRAGFARRAGMSRWLDAELAYQGGHQAGAA